MKTYDDVLYKLAEASIYGLPEKKKYPMPDAAHVRSAIRFFNYVSPEDEPTLAKAIKSKMKAYGVNDVKIGDKNRLKNYVKTASTLEERFKNYKPSNTYIDKQLRSHNYDDYTNDRVRDHKITIDAIYSYGDKLWDHTKAQTTKANSLKKELWNKKHPIKHFLAYPFGESKEDTSSSSDKDRDTSFGEVLKCLGSGIYEGLIRDPLLKDQKKSLDPEPSYSNHNNLLNSGKYDKQTLQRIRQLDPDAKPFKLAYEKTASQVYKDLFNR